LAANPEASPKSAVEALKQQGIEVSFALAKVVKYGKYGKGKKTSAKKAKRTSSVKSRPVVSGSESIRRFIAKNPTATTKEIVTALHGQGIEVSVSLVDKVRSRSNTKRATVRRKGTPTSARRPKLTVNKSESIRDFLRRNPGAMPKVVQAGLRKEGVKVATSLVSNVAFNFRKKNAAPRVRMAARRVSAKASRKTVRTGLSIEQLLSVKQFADLVGGADQVRSALDLLAQLQ
jgi:hypothetical protein